ncbi:GNAT family N-acetyltransferase [Pseudonocardia endophytica]|uniref:Acetyltransferase (GNAT) family protein n=1 Tax=Pseudonocardia endophytica TaxID=401976 RepID=A0A4R1HUN0_PSEEN|nr:N-acetyltransferase [Pseudonocardia endophytica]TCK25968.1 acetyltransferase (GNAT) family protein [Pseudonocardia endophytica]
MTDEIGAPRQATPGDVEGMVDVVAIVAPEGSLGAQHPVDREMLRERYGAGVAAEHPTGVWVVDVGGRVGGFALVFPPGPTGVLDLAMALLPEARGRGAGRALLDTALAHARANDVHKVELEAWVDNARAIALYTAAGFVVEGVRRDHYRRRDGSLRSTLLMAVHLAD